MMDRGYMEKQMCKTGLMFSYRLQFRCSYLYQNNIGDDTFNDSIERGFDFI